MTHRWSRRLAVVIALAGALAAGPALACPQHETHTASTTPTTQTQAQLPDSRG